MIAGMSGVVAGGVAAVAAPPVIALTSHTIATAGAVGNGIFLFGVGVLRAFVGLVTTTIFAGEWLQSGAANPADFEVFSVFVSGSPKHASGALFSQWHNLSGNPSFVLETTGSFTLQIRRIADGALMTPQVLITLT